MLIFILLLLLDIHIPNIPIKTTAIEIKTVEAHTIETVETPILIEKEYTEIVASVTAYTSHPDETDDTPNINAAGTTPHQGSIACPKRYKFGTEVQIKGVSYFCDDRMNDRFPDRFDIWMTDRQEALRFGVKQMEIKIIH